MRWSDFAGRYRIVYFGYTFCPDACPTDLATLMRGFDRFAAKHPAQAARTQPMFITIDPARDTPKIVGEFAGCVLAAPHRPHRQRGAGRRRGQGVPGLPRQGGRDAGRLPDGPQPHQLPDGSERRADLDAADRPGRRRGRRGARQMGEVSDKRFWEQPLETLDRGQWEALCDGCGQVLPAQAGGRRHRRILRDQRRLHAARPHHRALQGLCAAAPDRARLRAADRRPRADARLAAGDLRLPPARRGIAAARLALPRQRKPRRGAPRGRIGDRPRDQRGRRRARSSSTSSGRTGTSAGSPRYGPAPTTTPTMTTMLDWLRGASIIGPRAVPTVELATRRLPIAIQRRANARHMTLRLAPDGSEARVSIPRHARSAEAIAFVRSRADWLEAQLGTLPARVEVGPGALVPYRGAPLVVVHARGAPRRPVPGLGELRCGGAVETLSARIARWAGGRGAATAGRRPGALLRPRRRDPAEARAVAGAAPLGQLRRAPGIRRQATARRPSGSTGGW